MVRLVLLVLIFLGVGAWVVRRHISSRMSHTHFSVADRLQQYGPAADARLLPYFQKANVTYPPSKVVLVGLKSELKLQVYAADGGGILRFVREYPIRSASGVPGPKLQEGDGQVPEGLYNIDSLNPNSLYHLALRVGYPNDWDQEQARKEGRTNLGEDIMIHGAAGSAGCLAMGDEISEDLFVLVARTGIENTRLILSPVDFRVRSLPDPMPAVPAWTGQLYASIKTELSQLPKPGGTN